MLRATSSIPLAALIVWGIVVHGTYNSVEKIFLSASAFYVALHRVGRARPSRLEGGRVCRP